MTSIPNRPWDTVSIGHGGPYPNGYYNLVLINKGTSYPVVESAPSTDFQTNKERLKHIFVTYGTPRRIESDNRPPFNSKEFNKFAKQERFQHHRVTALHPRANGEVERFMQTLNKTEQIANLQGKTRLERRMQFKTCSSLTGQHRTQLQELHLTKPLRGIRENELGLHWTWTTETWEERWEGWHHRPQRRRIQAENGATERREKDRRE